MPGAAIARASDPWPTDRNGSADRGDDLFHALLIDHPRAGCFIDRSQALEPRT